MLARDDRRPIRVLIADDHRVVRIGIARLLEDEPDVEVVGLACDGDDAVAMCASRAPDVILMDLQMPGVDGLEATRRIVASGGPPIVVLTSFCDRARITEAVDSGAVGYLLKQSRPEELIAGIRAAAAGESPLAPRVALTLVREWRGGGAPEELTDREREVLALVGAGVTNKQIAYQLGISPKTVKTHLGHVFRRIGVTDRLQAALWARRHGLVEAVDGSPARP